MKGISSELLSYSIFKLFFFGGEVCFVEKSLLLSNLVVFFFDGKLCVLLTDRDFCPKVLK